MPEASAWPKLTRAINREIWLDDERFKDGKARYQNMAALVALIDEALAAHGRDEWGRIFDEHGIIWGPVLALHEVAADPHAEAIGLFPEIEHPEFGSYRTVNVPMRFANADVKPRGPAPAVGEHSRELLAELGVANAEIEQLISSGVIHAGE